MLGTCWNSFWNETTPRWSAKVAALLSRSHCPKGLQLDRKCVVCVKIVDWPKKNKLCLSDISWSYIMLRYIICMSKRLFGGCWSPGCWAGEAGELHFFTFLCLEPATHLVRISWGKASPSSLFAYKVSAHKSQPKDLTINAWNWEKTTFTRQQTLGILTTQTGVW